MIFSNNEISARLVESKDKSVLLKWPNNPIVLEFYEGRDKVYTEYEIEIDFYTESDKTRLIIEIGHKPIGYLQFYRIDNNGYIEYEYDNKNETVFGIDLFIGEYQLWNKGHGTDIIILCLEYLFGKKNVNAVIIDPHCTNERAIHVYEKVGFKKIKILKSHELHEKKIQDCWLMECRKEHYVPC